MPLYEGRSAAAVTRPAQVADCPTSGRERSTLTEMTHDILCGVSVFLRLCPVPLDDSAPTDLLAAVTTTGRIQSCPVAASAIT